MDEWLYRLLLTAYPRAFRDAFGPGLLEAYRYRRERARATGGSFWWVGFWRFVVWDLVRTACQERLARDPVDARTKLARVKRGGGGMDAWMKDLTYSTRRLVRSPGFTLSALMILSLGIGFNTAAFSLVNAVLLQPPPFPEHGRLVEILQDQDGGGPTATSYPAFLDIAEHEDLFARVGARTAANLRMDVGGGAAVQIQVEYATSGFLPALGLTVTRGRWFDPTEDHLESGPVAVVTYAFWRNHFGGDPGILGSVVRLNGASLTVVGIGPEAYSGGLGLGTSDFWLSISSMDDTNGAFQSLTRRQDHPMRVVARLAPGVTPEAAQDVMDQLARQLATAYPDVNRDRGIHVLPLQVVGAENRASFVPGAVLLMGVVGLVLLVASINLANLLMVRGASRGREIGVRLALGGSRPRLIRVVFGETLLLAAAGAALGLALTRGLMVLLGRLDLAVVGGGSLDIHLDWRVLLFTLAAAGGASLLAGLLPALRITSPGATSLLRERPSSPSGRRYGLVGLLVSAQVAISLVLLVASGLFIDSLIRAGAAHPGFDADNLAVLRVDLNGLALEADDVRSTYDELERRVEVLPGVLGATYTRMLPASPGPTTTLLLGDLVDGRRRPVEVRWNVIRGDYFSVLVIPLLHGRLFDDRDRGDAPARVVVNRAMAEAFWGRPDVVGEIFHSEGAPERPIEVIGVVETAKVTSMTEEPTPQVFFDGQQSAALRTNLVVRTEASPLAVLPSVRAVVREVDDRAAVLMASTMDGFLRRALGRQRLVSRVLLFIGAVALALAALGIYAVVSFRVARRVGEVGIRMALGAERSSVVRLFMREIVVLVSLGALTGLVLAVPLARLLGQAFTGAQGLPGHVLLACVATLAAAALLATAIPARRAANLDPARTLRLE